LGCGCCKEEKRTCSPDDLFFGQAGLAKKRVGRQAGKVHLSFGGVMWIPAAKSIKSVMWIPTLQATNGYQAKRYGGLLLSGFGLARLWRCSHRLTMNGIPGACWRAGNRCIFAFMMIMDRNMTNGLAQAEFGVKRYPVHPALTNENEKHTA